MFGLSFAELLVIMVVTLVVVGPDKLPEVARTVGRTLWQLKHTLEELRKEAALPSLADLRRELIMPPPTTFTPPQQTATPADLNQSATDAPPMATSSLTTESDDLPIFEPQLEGTCEEYKLQLLREAQKSTRLKNDDTPPDC